MSHYNAKGEAVGVPHSLDEVPESLPDQVTLGPFTYRITEGLAEWEASDQDPARLHGYTDHERGVIIIHANTSPAMRRVVLLHELMHAAVFASGGVYNRRRHEETWVLQTAPLLLDALRRSPDVLAFLTADDDDTRPVRATRPAPIEAEIPTGLFRRRG